MYVFFIVYRMPYETSVLIHFNIADSRAAEYFLGNFVIEAFPFDKDGDDSTIELHPHLLIALIIYTIFLDYATLFLVFFVFFTFFTHLNEDPLYNIITE